MSASGADQVQDPVLASTDPVIFHEVPVPVDDQILKDVSNLGNNETPESATGDVASPHKTDASNGGLGPTTSTDEKENVPPSHEQPVAAAVRTFVDNREASVHGSEIASERTEDVQDGSVVEADSAASNTIPTDNVDNMTLNEKGDEMAIKGAPGMSEVENVVAAEHEVPADSDRITPVADITEANTNDDSVKDSAIENPAPALEKKQGCAKDDESDATSADGAKLVETGIHNEAPELDATDNVGDTPDVIMNQAPNGETLAIEEIALQEKGYAANIDVSIASSVAKEGPLIIDAVPETKEENASATIVQASESNVTDSVIAQVDAAKTIEQTQDVDLAPVAEEQTQVVGTTSTEANLNADEAVVVADTDIAVESNETEVTNNEVEESHVGAKPTNNLDVEPLVEEARVSHEVEPAAEDPSNVEGVSSHEELASHAVEEVPKVTEFSAQVIEESPVTGDNVAIAVDETTEALETIEEPTNDTEASTSTLVGVESTNVDVAPGVDVTYEESRPALEVEPVVANETTAAPVEVPVANDTVHEAAPVPVEEEAVPTTAPTAAPETTNENAFAQVQVEPLTTDEEIVPTTVDKPVTSEAAAEVGSEEAPVQLEVEPIAVPVDEPMATGAEPEVSHEDVAARAEAEPLPANEAIGIPAIEGEVAPTDEIGIAAPEASADPYDVPSTIEIQHEVEHIGSEANEETTTSAQTESVVGTEGAEKANEVRTAEFDDVTQEVPRSVEPESIPTSSEVAVTVVEAEEPTPAPVELSEEISTTPMNVENEEILASVVEGETIPIEVPVKATHTASLETEHDVAGEAAPSVVTEAGETSGGTDSDNPPHIDVQPQAISLAENAADVSESVGEHVATEASAPALGIEVAVEESTSASVVETVAAKDNGPELRTSVFPIETSLDTTPFTPVLDSGIELKEQEPAFSRLDSIAEELERPKSPWPSSFQVSTVGGGESSEVGDVGRAPEITQLAETGEPASVPLLIIEDTPVDGQVPTIGPAEDIISVDQPPLEPPPRPWTPSYSVHSQGSPTAVEPVEDLPSTDEPVLAHEPTVEEQESMPVEGGFKAETVNHEPFEQVIDATTSTVDSSAPSTEEVEQVPEPAPADLTEVSKEISVAVGEEEASGNDGHKEAEKPLTVVDEPARSWTASYSTHSQGTPPVATSELENVHPTSLTTEVALSAEARSHAENAVTDEPKHDKTVDEQVDANPVIALEGQRIEDETTNPQQSSPAEINSNLENVPPPRPWTPSYSIHSQGSPAAVPKELEEASSLDATAVEQSIPESVVATSFPVDAQEISHPEPLTTEPDKDEIPSSVEQSQNNIGGFIAAGIAPTIALASMGARIQSLLAIASEEAPQVDGTPAIDKAAVPQLSVPSGVPDEPATDTNVDGQEEPPRSPWTPSYSVTKQGAGLSQAEEAEIDHLEPLPPAAAQPTASSDLEPQLNEVQESESASNALQTRPSYDVAGTEDIAKNEQFFLFGLRAIVAYLWVLPKWLAMTPSDHSRRGSSSSTSSSSTSKLFPGGWFTPKPKEGRTSYDVAQGEFASPTKATTSNDVFETLGPEATNSSVAVDDAVEDYGQKRKWCIIM